MIQSTRPRRRRDRSLRALISFLFVVGAVVVAVALTPAAPASAATAHATAAPPCQEGDTCVVVPCSSSPCPTVEAGPTSNLGADGGSQYVFINLYNFPVGDLPAVWYCSATKPLANGPPLCAVAPSPQQLPVFSDGTAFVSYQVEEVENDGGTAPLNGEIPGDASSTGTFFCDDGSNPCALDIFDTALDGHTTPDTNNTAVVPLNFVPSSSGCPKGTVVASESDFGIEGLIKQVAPAECSGVAPAIPVNTAQNSLSAVQDLVAGRVQIAFTDDPQAADEQSALAGSGARYAYIPLAASADVVGFGADESETSNPFVLYPDTSFDLTPNMVAGLLSMQYAAPGSADLLPAVGCTNPVPGKPTTLKPCPAMQAVNAPSGFLPPSFYWGIVRSDNSGVTDELLSWLCAAQDHSVPIAGQTDTEAKTAAQVLAAAPWANKSQNATCPTGDDQFPALSGTGDWAAENSPAAQARDVLNELADEVPSRDASFATMNWYEALYYGLNVAQLQNAAGQFVAPTAQSVDAALADATVNTSDGVLTNTYTNSSDAAAYPTPVVIYAVVPADPSSAAAAIGTELRSILAVTTAADGSGIPPGLMPLPSKLATDAIATVNTDFPAPSTSPDSGSTPPSNQTLSGSHSPGSSGSSLTGGSGRGSTTFGTGVSNVTDTSTGPSSGKTATPTTTPLSTSKQKAQRADFLGLVPPGGRWLLIALLVAGAVAILLGPAILGMMRVRRRDGDEDADGGPSPTPDSMSVT
jgi:hypothetical protein